MKMPAAFPPRQRADVLLVERGLFESRAKAQAAIAAGLVTADAVPVRKASEAVAIDAALAAEPAFPWVSRGGVKLDAALTRFGVAVLDRICLDVGASTGGFTQVLLARGARRIYAIDVGTAQLHPHLRGEPKIVSLEHTDVRTLDPNRLDERPDFITIDVSFISLKSVLPAAFAVAGPPAHVLALVKPQFEAQRAHIKKGIVRDPAVHEAVVADIAAHAVSLGCRDIVSFPSPIAGRDGNLEFFVGAKLG
jgi:23S rRNA (cytidine1920-2'-O)/16S rRNA (cytidine1409-2'-O)-methyltransferase